MEHSEYLVGPKFDHLFFAFVVIFFGFIHSLENLTDVSHIENIVRFGRSWQEVIRNLVVNVDGCLSKRLWLALDFFEEGLEFCQCNCVEDLHHIGFIGNSVIDSVELTQTTRRNFSTTSTSFTHRSNNLQIANKVLGYSSWGARVPELVFYVLTDQLKWWLWAICVFSWHV